MGNTSNGITDLMETGAESSANNIMNYRASENRTPRVYEDPNNTAMKIINTDLPKILEQTRAFGSSNSQTSLVQLSLTMLNGNSPFRMVRQTMAEIEKRTMALNEAKVNLAKAEVKIDKLRERLKENPNDKVLIAKLSSKMYSLDMMKNKIDGAIKDIATLVAANKALIKKNGIPEDWSEADFEASEVKFHARRTFELLYRDLLNGGRPSQAVLEYSQQNGLHIQVISREVRGYIQHTEKRINEGDIPDALDLEHFLDRMVEKYSGKLEEMNNYIFGKDTITDTSYMFRLEDGSNTKK